MSEQNGVFLIDAVQQLKRPHPLTARPGLLAQTLDGGELPLVGKS